MRLARIHRLGICLIALLGVSLGAQAQTLVAHGLIVQLKPGAQTAFSRELPSAAQAKRESLANQRMAAVSQGAGVRGFAHRQLSGDHRLMQFAKPLQGAELNDTMRRLRLHPDVASVEPNVRVPLANTPNDSYFSNQWHFGSRASAPVALEMSPTWAITTGTSSVTIAVVDSGILRNHPDLSGLGSRLLPGYDFVSEVDFANDGDGRDSDPSDPGDWVTAQEADTPQFSGCDVSRSSWHGTFIAGQLVAQTNNSAGVAGMNWNARLLPVRVSGKCGAYLADLIDGLRWAAGLSVANAPQNLNPAKVINLSFGGSETCASNSAYQSAIDEIVAAGSLVVVSAGNGDGNESRQLKRPADCRGVMAVGAVQRDGAKTDYSFVGSNMALMAPGGHGDSVDYASNWLLSIGNSGQTIPNQHGYYFNVGTSFAAPLAAGVASLMLAVNPSLTPDALISRMKFSARMHPYNPTLPSCTTHDKVACNCTTSLCGAGLLNPWGAVQLAANFPAAVIAPVGNRTFGDTILLDGRGSVAMGTATLAAYAWRQVSGPAVSLPQAHTSVTQVVLPQQAGTLVFELTVTDSLGRSGSAELSLALEAPLSTGGGGGGGADRQLLMLLVLIVMALLVQRVVWARQRRT
jgi:serine protease